MRHQKNLISTKPKKESRPVSGAAFVIIDSELLLLADTNCLRMVAI